MNVPDDDASNAPQPLRKLGVTRQAGGPECFSLLTPKSLDFCSAQLLFVPDAPPKLFVRVF